MLELCRCPNIYGPDCKSLWIKASAKCINVNVNVLNPKFLNIIQGGDHLDPAICPFEGFLERRGVPSNLMGPPKILYLSVRSEAVPIYLNTAYRLVHQNLFRLYTDLCKNL